MNDHDYHDIYCTMIVNFSLVFCMVATVHHSQAFIMSYACITIVVVLSLYLNSNYYYIRYTANIHSSVVLVMDY